MNGAVVVLPRICHSLECVEFPNLDSGMCVPRNECPFGGVQLLVPVAAFDPRMQCNSKEQSQA